MGVVDTPGAITATLSVLVFRVVGSGYGESERMDMDPVPGAMGQISSTSMAYGSTGETGFDDEPPLLEGATLLVQINFYDDEIIHVFPIPPRNYGNKGRQCHFMI